MERNGQIVACESVETNDYAKHSFACVPESKGRFEVVVTLPSGKLSTAVDVMERSCNGIGAGMIRMFSYLGFRVI